MITPIPTTRRIRAASLIAFAMCLAASHPASAGTFSETGTLAGPTDYVTFVLHLSFSGSLGLQTYSFGGGTNHDGTTIPAGGFDPFVGLFAGTGDTATFLDGTSDGLSNYTSEPSACPPAGTVTLGSQSNACGDVRLVFSGLTAGLYTVVLSDAFYQPNAVYEIGGVFGDGFTDLTGDTLPLQTCDTSTSACIDDTQNWALDIFGPEGSTLVTPEPASIALSGIGLMAFGYLALRRRNALHKQL